MTTNLKRKISNGKLFVFEGVDQVGKSTIVKELEMKLKDVGLPFTSYSFPGKTEGTLGALVYDLHHNEEKYLSKPLDPASLQILHVAAHIDTINNKIIPDLKSGKIVLLDRFWWSTYAYGIANGINKDDIKDIVSPERKILKKVQVNEYFFITRNNNENSENNYLKKVQSIYEMLLSKKGKNESVTIISNNDSIENAVNTIFEKISINVDAMKSSVLHHEKLPKSLNIDKNISLHVKTSEVKTTQIYDTYWKFAAERQNVFFNRYYGEVQHLTEDPILQKYKFTNVYRASDRVSQYLIKNVIYNGNSYSSVDQFFRIMLFKFFNKIETWEYLQSEFGDITYENYKFEYYDKALTKALTNNNKIYSAAYIMPSGQTSFGYEKKHQNNLKLLEKMMYDQFPLKIGFFNSLEELYENILIYPTLGKFLAFQYCIDINYSELCNFDENSFVVAGPGAINGIDKCFQNSNDFVNEDLIKYVQESQEKEFDRLGLNFKSLWGRPLQLIDCQNLFCETDKYSRVAHPSFNNGNRKRIKQLFVSHGELELFYPPKWNVNQHIKKVMT